VSHKEFNNPHTAESQQRAHVANAQVASMLESVCLGRGPTDSNSSILYFGFFVFSVIWGFCFSLKANPMA
jgi:hypothetical protein